MGVFILSPVSMPDINKLNLSVRPRLVAGLRVAMVDNTKENGSVVLDRFEDVLIHKYEAASVTRYRKPGRTVGVSSKIIAEIKEKCDVVISALGD